MQKLMLLGDEAIAQAAIDSGISGIYAYPGTPSTEIMEYVQKSRNAAEKKINMTWSANEKTAMEAALGMSYAGKRAMVAMKHVGLNVAADGFVNSALTGVNGGLIVVAADDPSMHSSQNEQDSRFYGSFSFIPVFEPSNQQEAYNMVFSAFELSEKYKIPVLFRITTRLAHSRSGIIQREEIDQNSLSLPQDPKQFVLLPAIARRKYKALLKTYEAIGADESYNSFNAYIEGSDKSLGIICTGIAFNYLMENFGSNKLNYPVLKITKYPVDEDQVKKFTSECADILVLEEGYPMIEEMLNSFGRDFKNVKGRLDGTIPRDGELNPNIISRALGLEDTFGTDVPDIVKNRPPSLCKGCSHADMYHALNEVMAEVGSGRVFADIGCYTLGALPPFNAINSCVDMGASITMAIGAADAGLVPSVAIIGDSTFTHSGMTGLLDAVIKESPITVVISDNATTGMTGGQTSHATDRLQSICTGIGVDPHHLITLNPLRKNHSENVEHFRREIAYNGVSVIISQRECIQTVTKRKKKERDLKSKTL